MTDEERAAWVALALVPGIGPARLRSLLEICQTPLGALSAPFAFLCTIPGMSVAAATAVKATTLAAGQRVLEQVERAGGRTLVAADAEFPDRLRQIPDPPPLLFAQGRLAALAPPAVAIVGSRDHSGYGEEVARQMAWEAAAAGAVVVSGMARGLDAVAHGAALDAGGSTIGVLGNGLGVVYPAANRLLYERVIADGLLLTEFPPGERPNAGSFPRRNRIISGLARVTVVVEAGEGSGALITAGAALDQGREVMAVPGPVTSPQSVGPNRLIRDGAAPLLEPRDLLDHYPDATPPERARQYQFRQTGPVLTALPQSLGEGERAVAELLGADSIGLDDLIDRSGRSARELLSALCGLEIAGVVEQGPGRVFRRI
ncbi:MAG: DNA-protecting protein DprA [Gemmatimonadales bacterium]|nr:DNA-protecting protein DprA [Gemmatimonadales bacterium]MBA3555601.1 DNA-protecting protein DprA [Gemmatimonadales bacterium]